MKITAEFNSNEELLSFISTFGAKITTGQALYPVVGGTKEPVTTNKVGTKQEVKKETPKEEIPKDEDIKITKEMVRSIFSKLIKAGKQKEAKEITERYGAKRLPDLEEEHYAAAYKDAEGLL